MNGELLRRLRKQRGFTICQKDKERTATGRRLQPQRVYVSSNSTE